MHDGSWKLKNYLMRQGNETKFNLIFHVYNYKLTSNRHELAQLIFWGLLKNDK